MNNLNTRERFLLIIILSFLPVGGLYYGWTTYSGMREYRQSEILKVEAEKNRLHQLSLRAGRELDRFDEAYNAASLPQSVAGMTVTYQNFLNDLLLQNGLEVSTIGKTGWGEVEYEAKDRMGKTFKEPAYNVLAVSDIVAKGSITQLTNFLYDFYDLAILHRVDKMNISLVAPEKEDETRLSIKFTVQALVLPSGPDTKSWSEYAKGRLGKPRTAYQDLVVARNLFGPPNSAPSIRTRAAAEVEVGANFSHKFSAEDGNAEDRLTYELLSSDLEGFSLATSERDQTATLSGPRVDKAGKYQFKVRVSDNRIPLLMDEQNFVLTVAEPEPEPVREPEPPKPPRSFAPDTFITSLVQDKNGVATIILTNRGNDQLIKRNEGETFELDGITWTVVKVDRRSATLRKGEQVLEYRIGSSLEKPITTEQTLTSTESASR
ncbi:MAG: hypothetical protein JNL67_20065 [Planctomycetaceae bacterium]|nr:hypothetical protein [Planctomycetaceae bacterium]